MANKDSVCTEEDKILSDYLSYCHIDTVKHHMDLPNKEDHEIPKGFACTFYRGAEEKIYHASFENEEFIIIVLDEKGWDSDTSNKRDQKQVCIPGLIYTAKISVNKIEFCIGIPGAVL